MSVKELKQRFFALRNGMLADALRKQCADPHRLIFGLNLPQLKSIAAETGTDPDLAAELWADRGCRESRLLAPMVMERGEAALAWLGEVQSVEEADVVCHSLLRHCPGAAGAARRALASADPVVRYCALRLIANLMPGENNLARQAVESIEPHPLTDAVVHQLRTSIEDYVGDI